MSPNTGKGAFTVIPGTPVTRLNAWSRSPSARPQASACWESPNVGERPSMRGVRVRMTVLSSIRAACIGSPARLLSGRGMANGRRIRSNPASIGSRSMMRSMAPVFWCHLRIWSRPADEIRKERLFIPADIGAIATGAARSYPASTSLRSNPASGSFMCPVYGWLRSPDRPRPASRPGESSGLSDRRSASGQAGWRAPAWRWRSR